MSQVATKPAATTFSITYTGATSAEIKRFMRANKAKIRDVAERLNISMKLVRKFRNNGASFLSALSIWNGVTGEEKLPSELSAMLQVYRETMMHKTRE